MNCSSCLTTPGIDQAGFKPDFFFGIPTPSMLYSWTRAVLKDTSLRVYIAMGMRREGLLGPSIFHRQGSFVAIKVRGRSRRSIVWAGSRAGKERGKAEQERREGLEGGVSHTFY
jgi:hypothetical protein